MRTLSRSRRERHQDASRSSPLTPPVTPSCRPSLSGIVLMPRSLSPPPGCVGSTRGAPPPRPLPPPPPFVPLTALPAGGSMAGVQESLLELHRCLQPGDAGAAMHGYSLLRSLGETCLTSPAGGAQGAPWGPVRLPRVAVGSGSVGSQGLLARRRAAVPSLVSLKQQLHSLGGGSLALGTHNRALGIAGGSARAP